MDSIKTKPSNRAEQDCYLYLCASLSDLIEAQEKMERRIRLVPRGWWMIRVCTSLLTKLLRGIWQTFEPEKRRQIQRTSERVRHKLIIGQQATTEEEQYVVAAKDFGVLMCAASDKCGLCMGTPQDCKRCDLGKVIDGLSFISRQDRAWWEVFSQAQTRTIGEEPGYVEE